MILASWIEQIKHAHALKHKYCKVCKQDNDIKVCSRCKDSVYCSIDCQTVDYKVHQKLCNIGAITDKRKATDDLDSPDEKRLDIVLDDDLSKLPKDIVKLIVNRLSKTDLDNLTQSASWINNLIKKYVYGKKVRFVIRDMNTFVCDRNNSLFQTIQSLDVGSDVTPAHIFDINDCFPNLQSLTLHNSTKNDYIKSLPILNNLRMLKLVIYDGDITPITFMSNLRTLIIPYFNGDFAPLINLVNLTHLNLSQVVFSVSLDPIPKMTNLRVLDIYEFDGDISSLSSLIYLEDLRISIGGELSPLLNLKNLKSLTLGRSDADLTPLIHMSQLRSLVLIEYGQEGGDTTPLAQMTQLRKLYHDGSIYPETLKNLTNLRVINFDLIDGDLESLTHLKELRVLKLGNNIDNFTPISELRNLRELKLGTIDADLTPLLQLDKLQILKLPQFEGKLWPITRMTQLQKISIKGFKGSYADFKQRFIF